MTIPNYGIHKKFLESDQRMWVHTCPHCGYEQVLDYEKNIVCNNPKGIDEIGRIVQPGTFSFVCQKCGGILDRWYDGQWVAMAPSIGRAHGYQISQLDAVNKPCGILQ